MHRTVPVASRHFGDPDGASVSNGDAERALRGMRRNFGSFALAMRDSPLTKRLRVEAKRDEV
ncbi:MAG: hypothetical protein IPK07_29025 [Deltaproteobacteria bacterium]|nr:hypothetical protein [Deltaproteobacteria bacterium]